jgi:hypothetical protein
MSGNFTQFTQGMMKATIQKTLRLRWHPPTVQKCAEQPYVVQDIQTGNVLAVFRALTRRTAYAFLRLHDQRNQLADEAELERFFLRNSHIANDVGLTPERRLPEFLSK